MSALLILVSARFDFDLVIYCSFLLVLGYLYLMMVIRGSFTLEKLVDFISAHLWLNVILYYIHNRVRILTESVDF